SALATRMLGITTAEFVRPHLPGLWVGTVVAVALALSGPLITGPAILQLISAGCVAALSGAAAFLLAPSALRCLHLQPLANRILCAFLRREEEVESAPVRS